MEVRLRAVKLQLLLLGLALLPPARIPPPVPQELLRLLPPTAPPCLAQLADPAREVGDLFEYPADVPVAAVAEHRLLHSAQELGKLRAWTVLQGAPVFINLYGLVQSAHEAVVSAS